MTPAQPRPGRRAARRAAARRPRGRARAGGRGRRRRAARVARRDRGAEQRGLRGGGGGLAVGERSGSRRRDCHRVHARLRDDDDRRERQVDGDPRGVRPAPFCQIRQTPPRSAAARLSAWPSSGSPSSSSSSGGGASGRGRARRRARRDRRGAGAEPAPERDAVDEAEAASFDRRDERERPQREVLGVGHLAAPSPSTTTLAVRPPRRQLVPEVERGRGAVEPRPEVRRGRGRTHDDRPVPSDLGEDRLDARLDREPARSGRRPPRVLQAVAGEDADDGAAGSSAIRASAARPAADDGSQKTPSRPRARATRR